MKDVQVFMYMLAIIICAFSNFFFIYNNEYDNRDKSKIEDDYEGK